MIRILRPRRKTGLISAEVFEEIFVRQLGRAFHVSTAPLASWCAAVLGPPEAAWPTARAARAFAVATKRADFLCPSYEGLPLAPQFAALRNRSCGRVRLLLIAHAPGACALEWALLGPLLMDGDLIVAPSRSARDLIVFLDPALERFVRVIPHPMTPLNRLEPRASKRAVSLGRLHPGKLVHRQLEALRILRERGHDLEMEIAGPVSESGAGRSPYVRALGEMIRRLGMRDSVRLIGPVRGERQKAAFLAGARMLVNLSVTVEESFGKAPVEALGIGVPAVVTRWDGLPQTIGSGGIAVPVECPVPGTADIDAATLADAMECILDSPPRPEACMAQAARFHPDVVLRAYRRHLEAALGPAPELTEFPAWPAPDRAAAPAAGLLAVAAPLTSYTWTDLFGLYILDCRSLRAHWERGPAVVPPTTIDRLRNVLLTATRAPLQRFLSGREARVPRPPASATKPKPIPGADYTTIMTAATATAGILPTSRVACLMEAREHGRADLVREGLGRLEADGVTGAGMDFLRADALAGDAKFADAFALCLSGARNAPETEAVRLRQLAQIGRRWGRPERALPWLAEWLGRFPDSPDSGLVWLEYGVNAARAGPGWLDAAGVALSRAQMLLGDIPLAARGKQAGTVEIGAPVLSGAEAKA